MLKMTLSFITGLFVVISATATAAATATREIKFNQQFYISTEVMIANMVRQDVTAGAIIAAPSSADPDYFYHWVRDAALTVDTAIALYQTKYLTKAQRKNLRQFFVDHLKFNQKLQSDLTTAGLGEPKYSVFGAVYDLPWGRPQNDGPALRSLSIEKILNLATTEQWPQLEEIKKIVYTATLPPASLIKSDLEFVSHHWRDFNFDLWEEINGRHFYTLMTQRKSLIAGTTLANSFLDFGAAEFYKKQVAEINHELEKFWSAEDGFILATRDTYNTNKSHLDSAVILGLLHAEIKNETYSVADSRMLATFAKLKQRFESIYTVNQNKKFGVAFGRYPEDTYNGYVTNDEGNPWVLTTAAAAEFLYRAVESLYHTRVITIDSTNIQFYQKVAQHRSLRIGQKIKKGNPAFKSILQNLIAEGDGYLDRIIFHKNADGSLSEQINRYSGFMQGAPNLTWSHASFISAKLTRDRIKLFNLNNRGAL